MKIAVAGTGYVGLSLAVLLSQHNDVYAYDINEKKIELLKHKVSPIQDNEIEDFLANKDLRLFPTSNYEEAYKDAEFVILAVPTNYDSKKNYFDTSAVESAIKAVLSVNVNAYLIIKSTIPVGYTEKIKDQYRYRKILFAFFFLRESKALYDNLYPSRIIVGADKGDQDALEHAKKFASLLQAGAIKKDIPTLFMNSTEAEAVKLFANTYLALRVAYFNEMDTYALIKGLDTRSIIKGVCFDIGGIVPYLKKKKMRSFDTMFKSNIAGNKTAIKILKRIYNTKPEQREQMLETISREAEQCKNMIERQHMQKAIKEIQDNYLLVKPKTNESEVGVKDIPSNILKALDSVFA